MTLVLAVAAKSTKSAVAETNNSNTKASQIREAFQVVYYGIEEKKDKQAQGI